MFPLPTPYFHLDSHYFFPELFNCLFSNHSASSFWLLRSFYNQLVESFFQSTALIISFPGLKKYQWFPNTCKKSLNPLTGSLSSAQHVPLQTFVVCPFPFIHSIYHPNPVLCHSLKLYRFLSLDFLVPLFCISTCWYAHFSRNRQNALCHT